MHVWRKQICTVCPGVVGTWHVCWICHRRCGEVEHPLHALGMLVPSHVASIRHEEPWVRHGSIRPCVWCKWWHWALSSIVGHGIHHVHMLTTSRRNKASIVKHVVLKPSVAPMHIRQPNLDGRLQEMLALRPPSNISTASSPHIHRRFMAPMSTLYVLCLHAHPISRPIAPRSLEHHAAADLFESPALPHPLSRQRDVYTLLPSPVHLSHPRPIPARAPMLPPMHIHRHVRTLSLGNSPLHPSVHMSPDNSSPLRTPSHCILDPAEPLVHPPQILLSGSTLLVDPLFCPDRRLLDLCKVVSREDVRLLQCSKQP